MVIRLCRVRAMSRAPYKLISLNGELSIEMDLSTSTDLDATSTSSQHYITSC